MRVLAFLAFPADSASSRYRIVNFAPALAKAGVQVDICEPLPRFAARFRAFESGSTRQKALYYSLFLIFRTAAILQSRRYGAVLVQRDLFPFSLGVLERLLRRANRRIVYDIDDALHVAPKWATRSVFQRLRPLNKYDQMIRGARHVTVASHELMEHALKLNPAVTLIPMTLDTERYGENPGERRDQSGPLVLGWTGRGLGLSVLETLRPPLEALAARRSVVLKIVSGSRRTVNLGTVQVVRKPWCAETEVRDIQEFDIGLVPMLDNEFERARFPFKTLQYMAAGVPAVASPIGILRSLIRHGENGFLVSNTEGWIECLTLLADDPALRRRVGKAGQDTVRRHFSTERYAPVLAAVLKGTSTSRGALSRMAC